MVTAQTGHCLQTGKPPWYIDNTKVNSAFHPSWVDKSYTSLSGWSIFTCVGWQVTLCDPIRQVTLCSFEMGVCKKPYPLNL